MTLRIIPFEEIHMDFIRPREYEKDMIEFMGIERYQNMVKLYACNSKAFTAINNGEVVCCGGVLKVWDRVGEVWIFCSELMDDNIFSMSRQLIKHFREEFDEFDRVQAAIKLGFPKAIRLAECVGLEYEGTLRKFGPDGSDYAMYGRIK